MSIENIKERIQIQTRAYVPDQMGGYRLTWANGRELWAEVKPISLKVVTDESEDLATQRYAVRWRVGSQVPRTARLLWRGKSLRLITTPQEDVERRWIRVLAQEEGGPEDE